MFAVTCGLAAWGDVINQESLKSLELYSADQLQS